MFRKVIKEQWKFPAEVDHLGEMRDSVMHFGRKSGVSEQVINAFKLAIDEAGTNIIRHAYRDWDGMITMRMIIREKDVTVSLIDQGHSFDLRQVKDPDLQRYVDIGKKGGLGIFIIRRVIDKIDYRKTPEGNELRLTKSRKSEKRRFKATDMPFSMKTRFSGIATVVITAIVFAYFGWNYLRLPGKILGDRLASAGSLSKSLGHQSIEYLSVDPTPNFYDLSKMVAEIHREYYPQIQEIIVVDTLGDIQGIVEGMVLEPFNLPVSAKKIRENIYTYTYNKEWVYDVVEPSMQRVSPEKSIRLGTVHLLLNKEDIDRLVHAEQRRTIFKGVLALIIGCLFSFGLVWITMSPFKRLSKWIEDLGHGEVQDELEFDGTDEIGEIAQAFNDITAKFRKSQENVAEQERLQKEMQVAQEIQHTLLPDSFPDVEGYEIASYYEAAKEVGGDYFDFFRVDRDSLGIVVADVSGKGVPGSLVMTMIRTALRTEARGNKNAADVLSKVNDFVINDMKRGMFVTVFYIILDSKRRVINYASAGHNPMVLFRGESKKSYYLNPRGFPIGINLPDKALFRKSIESDTLQLRADDVLIIFTDGITEAMDSNRNRFGDERFLSVIRNHGNQKVEPLVGSIKDEINTFTGGYPQSDDITLVAIRERMSAQDVLVNMHTDLLKMVLEERMSVKDACEKAGVSTSTYYKYKKLVENQGTEGLEARVSRSLIEEKHLAIEDKAKMFDVIKTYPEFGPKRIREELNTEKYGFLELEEGRIYEELVRSRLNTKDLRIAFIERGGRGKRMKPPGTPLLTLDGKVIIDRVQFQVPAQKPVSKPASLSQPTHEETEQPVSGIELDVVEVSTKQSQGASEAISAPTTGEPDEPPTNEFETIDIEDEDALLADVIEEEFENLEAPPTDDADSDFEQDLLEENRPEENLEELIEDKTMNEINHVLNELIGEEENKTEEFVFEKLIDDFSALDMIDEEFESDPTHGEKAETGTQWPDEESSTAEEQQYSPDVMDEDLTDFLGATLIEEEMESLQTEEPENSESDEYNLSEYLVSIEGEIQQAIRITTEQNQSGSGKNKADRGRFFESGQWFYQEGLYARAIEEFKKAIECDPQYGQAFLSLGDAHFRLGQMEKAQNAYERARELMPNNIGILENLGVIYANQGHYKKAVWQWGEILKHEPTRQDIVERIKRMQRVIRQRAAYQKKS